MNNRISPRYQMSIIQNINDRLFELFKGYDDVCNYIEKWHEVDYYGNDENFSVFFKDNEQKKIDVKKTLHNIDGDTLLKIAIDLGIETPDYIPCIPTFKNELKSNYEIASQTFDKAFKCVEEDPSLAIGLANSALESIIKEILNDTRIDIQWSEKDTLPSLIRSICKAFHYNTDNSCPIEIKTIASSLISCSKAIEDLRSDKTILHGKLDKSYIVTDSLYAYFVVNAVTTIGLFFLKYFKTKYPQETTNTSPSWDDDNLPF